MDAWDEIRLPINGSLKSSTNLGNRRTCDGNVSNRVDPRPIRRAKSTRRKKKKTKGETLVGILVRRQTSQDMEVEEQGKGMEDMKIWNKGKGGGGRNVAEAVLVSFTRREGKKEKKLDLNGLGRES